MAFTVRFSDGLTTSYLDDWAFRFEDNGILVISDVANRFHYAPHAWICVEEDVDPARTAGVTGNR
jgi:hypothetical protein